MHGIFHTAKRAFEQFGCIDDVPFKVVSEREALEAAFFTQCRIADTGCWLWTGRLRTSGYGVLSNFNGRGSKSAHRLSHELFKGPIPEGLFVLHSCDVRACVNPAHLRAGTQKENIADCIARGRFRPGGSKRGSLNRLAKLTDADVLDIRNSTLSPKALRAKYGIDRTNIHAIITGKTWKHVPMPEVRVQKSDGRAKLTRVQVAAVKAADASISHSALARQLGVGVPLVCMIRKGRIWKDVAPLE